MIAFLKRLGTARRDSATDPTRLGAAAAARAGVGTGGKPQAESAHDRDIEMQSDERYGRHLNAFVLRRAAESGRTIHLNLS